MSISRKILIYLPLFPLLLFSCVFISYAKADGPNATLFFSAGSRNFIKSDEINISIKVKTPDQTINAVSGSFKIPKSFKLESIETIGSIMDFWVSEPRVEANTISFQGVAIKKPYQGDNGLVFTIKGVATTAGKLQFNFGDGAILADDGQGTNVLGSLKGLTLSVKDIAPIASNSSSTRPKVLTNNIAKEINDVNSKNITLSSTIFPPVITSDVPSINQTQNFTLKGKGTPNVLTKIKFQDITEPSFGVSLIRFLIKDRATLSDIEVKNDSNGLFSYVSPNNLVAGVYNALPEYTNSAQTGNIMGTGIKVFITENTLNKVLIIIINALVLIIPILVLILSIIFMIWYFIRRLHIMHKQMELDEKKIDAEERNLLKN